MSTQQFTLALPILGAISGDIIGSLYEKCPVKTKDIIILNKEGRWTDDTVLTIAVTDALTSKKDYETALLEWGRRFPFAGYGSLFESWLKSDEPESYNSYGNGSAMRVAAIGSAFDTLDETLEEAARSALPTHDHPEGIKGAQAVAMAIFLARTLHTKREIRRDIEKMFGYDLDRSIDAVRAGYTYNLTSQGTVPEAIISFLDSKNYEDAVRNAVSLGGDSDTLAAITGSIAAAFYRNIPKRIINQTMKRLRPEMIEVLERFEEQFHVSAKLAKSRTLDLMLNMQNKDYYEDNRRFINSVIKDTPSGITLDDLFRELLVVSGMIDEKNKAEQVANAKNTRRDV